MRGQTTKPNQKSKLHLWGWKRVCWIRRVVANIELTWRLFTPTPYFLFPHNTCQSGTAETDWGDQNIPHSHPWKYIYLLFTHCLRPYYGRLPLPPSTAQTSAGYLLQAPDANKLNSHFFFFMAKRSRNSNYNFTCFVASSLRQDQSANLLKTPAPSPTDPNRIRCSMRIRRTCFLVHTHTHAHAQTTNNFLLFQCLWCEQLTFVNIYTVHMYYYMYILWPIINNLEDQTRWNIS